MLRVCSRQFYLASKSDAKFFRRLYSAPSVTEEKFAGKHLRTLITGPPGSGKGTISEMLLENFPFVHLSSGDLLRHHIAKHTEIGAQ
eukprot:Pgem_evm2s14997